MSTSESNSLKRKAYFADDTTNKHIKLEHNASTTTSSVEDEQEDSVTLEFDVSFNAPLLKKMYNCNSIVTDYMKFYDNKNNRDMIIKKPRISIHIFGESLVGFIVSLLKTKKFRSFMCNCVQGSEYEPHYIALKNTAQIDEHVMKLFKIIRTNFDKYIAAAGQYDLEKGLVPSDFTDLNRDLIKKCFKKRGKGFILKYLSNDLRSDREIVLEAVKSDGLALEFASKELQSDEEIVKAAISGNGSALDFASDELKAKQSLQLLALKKLYHNIPKCIIQDIDDREFILQAVKNYPNIIRTVRTEFKSDREIVLAAVQQHGCWLEYASRELQSDRELVVLALNNYSKTNVPPELNSDKEIILARFCQRLISFYEVPNELKYDKDFILRALKKRYFKEFLSQIPKEMFRDSDIALFILKEVKQYDLFEYLEHIKRDEKHWLLEFLK